MEKILYYLPQFIKVPCTEQAATEVTEQILFLHILLSVRKDDFSDFKCIAHIPFLAPFSDVVEAIGTSISTSSQGSYKWRKRTSVHLHHKQKPTTS